MPLCNEIAIVWLDPITFDDRRRVSHELLDAIERRVDGAADSGWVRRTGVRHEQDRGSPRSPSSYAHFCKTEGPYRRDVIVTAAVTVGLTPLCMQPDVAARAVDDFAAAFLAPALMAQDHTYELREVEGHADVVPYLTPDFAQDQVAEILQLPDPRVEICEVDDGLGAIRLEGGFESVISFKGVPQLINWPDCRGSIGQYFVRVGQEDLEQELVAIRAAVGDRLRLDQPIATQVAPLMRLFDSGAYTLTNQDRTHIDAVLDGDLDELAAYYPDGCAVFLETRPAGRLEEATILAYQEAIARGARPLVVTASAGDADYCEFVVDGHHKLRAYLRNQTPPNVLNIHRDGAELSLDDGSHILQRSSALETYREVKSKYGMR